jgi:tryptophan 2,3-dioxygenase
LPIAEVTFVRDVECWLSAGADPVEFPYPAVIAEYLRVGKHFVDTDVLVGLDRARAALPAGPRPGLTLLRRFLDCALDKWDGRYDYHSYLALPVLSMALEGTGDLTPGRARRHRDRRYLHLLADLLRFELDVEAGRTDLLPRQRPDRDRLTKRLRLAVRAAQPVLARLSPLTTITATDPVAAAAEVCAAVEATTAERRDLRLTMLPVYVVHDEYLFLRVLQSYETTFALLVVLLRAARDALLRGAAAPAAEHLATATETLAGSGLLFSLLATMQPESFRTFRAYTEGASAIQSHSYKLVESLCRTPDQERLDSAAYRSAPEVRQRVLAGQSTLDQAYRAAVEGGLFDPTQRVLVADRMHGFAEALLTWRRTHHRLAVRMLGERSGTGYTEGTPYLAAVRTVPVFRSMDLAPAGAAVTAPAGPGSASPVGEPFGEGHQVTAFDGGGHQVGKGVRRAGEGRHPERGQRGGVLPIVGRGTLVGERQQHDHLDPGGGHLRHPAQHLLPHPALVEVADQDEDAVPGTRDQLLAVADRPVDVGAPAQLRAEQHLHRVAELVGEVHDRGVEDHQ